MVSRLRGELGPQYAVIIVHHPPVKPVQEMLKHVHILEIESSMEAQAMRSVAECFGAVVSVTWTGNSAQIVDFLSQTPAHELILICGHGDKRGVLLPELAEQVRARFPFNDVISPHDFAAFVRLNGNVVLSSCCATGTTEMARAFLENGAHFFIGPDDYPDGNMALLFEIVFVSRFLQEGDVSAAFDDARRCVEGSEMFQLFKSSQ